MKNESGSTLIELLIFLSIGSLLIWLATDVLLTYGRVYRKISLHNELRENTRAFTREIEKSVRKAYRIDTTNSTPTKLVLVCPIPTTSIQYDIEDGKLKKTSPVGGTSNFIPHTNNIQTVSYNFSDDAVNFFQVNIAKNNFSILISSSTGVRNFQ